jgi:hypothetical protein
MEAHGFQAVREVVGRSLPAFSTHHDLVERQSEKRAATAAARGSRDMSWGESRLQDETANLTSNE